MMTVAPRGPSTTSVPVVARGGASGAAALASCVLGGADGAAAREDDAATIATMSTSRKSALDAATITPLRVASARRARRTSDDARRGASESDEVDGEYGCALPMDATN